MNIEILHQLSHPYRKLFRHFGWIRSTILKLLSWLNMIKIWNSLTTFLNEISSSILRKKSSPSRNKIVKDINSYKNLNFWTFCGFKLCSPSNKNQDSNQSSKTTLLKSTWFHLTYFEHNPSKIVLKSSPNRIESPQLQDPVSMS